MKSRGLIIAIAASAITLTSCVSNKKYSSLQGEYDALNKEYNATQMALAESRANNKSLETMLAEARKRNQELKDDYAALQGSLDQSLKQSAQGSVNISKLVDEINASNKYIKQLVEAKSKSDSLNMVLTNNLTRSLSRDELQDVDIKVLKGVVYISLADNMLFKSGSYQINEKAMKLLAKSQRLSRITVTTMYWLKATPTMYPYRVQTFATTGISAPFVRHRSYRFYRQNSV